MLGRYIRFDKNIMGDDGCEYYSDVRYGIQDEDSSAFYLIGKNGSINKILKSGIENKYDVNRIEKEGFHA